MVAISYVYKREAFMKNNISKVCVGVDVSKSTLDVHIYPLKASFTVENSKVGITHLIERLSQYSIEQIACEATGGYEKPLNQLLHEAGYNLWIIDPRRIKGFIVASGMRAKTDKIDALKIAEFAAKNTRGYEAFRKTEIQEKLVSLVNRKNDLTLFLGSEKTRLKHPSHALAVKSIKKIIKTLEKEIKLIDTHIQKLIKQDDELSKKSEILESIPGIGKATAAVLLSTAPELGHINKSKISALIGVCPYNNQSGKYSRKRFIRGGRSIPRKALYM